MHLFCWTEAKGKVVKLIIEPRHIFYPNDPFIHFVFWNKERHHYYDYEKEHELFWKKNRNAAAVSSSFVVKSFNIFDKKCTKKEFPPFAFWERANCCKFDLKSTAAEHFRITEVHAEVGLPF